ncbi:unnamed protein product [Cylindrotheca closterium]|uniref:Uncharacterized protein n=1 Tax=Cylindrotheca closterium TaxID=2856 RepID=A0AAD2FNB9_9STRA|nr:unnamed protein product [Cylindrotheca closterium]CAJ1932334.1 unnamed protein product [Cylindrotheca closterium]CAJ1938844.1 unnamed protein product [Cylindrotheca closterium]CAJ1938846.1 unnamed protein product [Cylindrotheca closterium]CAJ1946945.1 unnamed protein product [Cylindrotheca closterium]
MASHEDDKDEMSGPTCKRIQDWHEQRKEEHHAREFAFQHCVAGLTLFASFPDPKPLPLKAFMMEYLGTAPQMSSLSFTFALEMLHKDFKKYMYPHGH